MSDSTIRRSLHTTTSRDYRRRLPVGVELADGREAHVRVWAPNANTVHVVTDAGTGAGAAIPLSREDEGYFSGTIAGAAGDRYQFTLDADDRRYPDPASRFQPDGPH